MIKPYGKNLWSASYGPYTAIGPTKAVAWRDLIEMIASGAATAASINNLTGE